MSATTGSATDGASHAMGAYRGLGGQNPAPQASTPSSLTPERPLFALGQRLRDLFNPRNTDMQRLLKKLEAQFQMLDVAHEQYLIDIDGTKGNGNNDDTRKDPKHPINTNHNLITDVHFAGRSATDPSIVKISTLLLDHDTFGCILEIWLNDNQISDEGASALASYLEVPSCSLLELWLGRNQIGPSGTISLSASLRNNGNSKLKCLGLYLNPIGNGGASALAQMLKKNNVLTTVDVHGCFYDAEKEKNYLREEVGITELYGGGCGCKIITPYDGTEYIEQVVASGKVEGAAFVADQRFMDAIQTFSAFNRMNPLRKQAIRGIVSSNGKVSCNAENKGEEQSDILAFLSDLRDQPANERLTDCEKITWKECEWQRLYAELERKRAAKSAIKTEVDAKHDLSFHICWGGHQ